MGPNGISESLSSIFYYVVFFLSYVLAITFKTNCKAVEEPFIYLLFLKMFFHAFEFEELFFSSGYPEN